MISGVWFSFNINALYCRWLVVIITMNTLVLRINICSVLFLFIFLKLPIKSGVPQSFVLAPLLYTSLYTISQKPTINEQSHPWPTIRRFWSKATTEELSLTNTTWSWPHWWRITVNPEKKRSQALLQEATYRRSQRHHVNTRIKTKSMQRQS